jgi:hypothetical protein
MTVAMVDGCLTLLVEKMHNHETTRQDGMHQADRLLDTRLRITRADGGAIQPTPRRR